MSDITDDLRSDMCDCHMGHAAADAIKDLRLEVVRLRDALSIIAEGLGSEACRQIAQDALEGK